MKNTVIQLSLWLAMSGLMSSSVLAANSVTVNIKGNLILNPPCDITGVGSGPIHVDFTDMVIRKITGTNYQQPVPYQLICDADGAAHVTLTFKGERTLFNNAALQTSNENLGVRFASNSGGSVTFVNLNTGHVRFTNNQRPMLYAYPLINNAVPVTNIGAGVFTASAMLEASYP